MHSRSAAATVAFAAALGAFLEPGDVIVLTGDLGSGKTTFVSGLASAVGVVDRVVSPTFTILRELNGRLDFAHLDLYRLERVSEVENVGIDELLDGNRVVVVEWGDIALPLLGDNFCKITLHYEAADPEAETWRTIEVHLRGRAWEVRRVDLVKLIDTFEGAFDCDESGSTP